MPPSKDEGILFWWTEWDGRPVPLLGDQPNRNPRLIRVMRQHGRHLALLSIAVGEDDLDLAGREVRGFRKADVIEGDVGWLERDRRRARVA